MTNQSPATVDLSSLQGLSDSDLNKLASELGLDDDDDEAQPGAEGKPVEGDPAAGSEGGASQPEPKAGEQAAPKLTGKDLLEQFQTDPEAQKLVQAQLQNWLADASATAEAKKEQEAFQELLKSGDYEEIGKRWVQAESEKAIQSKAEDAALTKAYGDVYGRLFKELETYQLTDAEKAEIAPEKYTADAEYVLALSEFIANKKSGSSVETMVDKRVEEKLTTLRNMKSAKAATDPSPSTLPAATGPTSGKETSRSLISDGFREYLEEASERGAAVQ